MISEVGVMNETRDGYIGSSNIFYFLKKKIWSKYDKMLIFLKNWVMDTWVFVTVLVFYMCEEQLGVNGGAT